MIFYPFDETIQRKIGHFEDLIFVIVVKIMRVIRYFDAELITFIASLALKEIHEEHGGWFGMKCLEVDELAEN